MARPTRKIATPAPVAKTARTAVAATIRSSELPAPNSMRHALDGAGPAAPVSMSLARTQMFPVADVPRTARETRAAALAMDFNGAITNALSFVEGTGFPGFPSLALLAQLSEYHAPAAVFADEAIRTWGESKSSGECEPAKLKAIDDEIARLKVRDVVRDLIVHDWHFGRAHAAFRMKGDDQIRETPLVPRPYTVRKGSFLGIKAVEPYWVTPNNYNSINPWADDFYKPSTWWMLGQEVHATRLKCMVARPLPDMLKPAYSFAGISMTQLAMPYVDNWLRTRQSVSDTVKQFSVVGLSMDLMQALLPGGNYDLAARADLINRYRDNRNILFVDKTQEEFFAFNVPLGGLDALQAQAQEHMAAVYHIPLVKLLGITPTGLNASSEGEIRVFYDYVKAYQKTFAQQLMDDVVTFVQLSLFGEVLSGVSWQWNPLHELNALELAEKNLKMMQTHTGYVAGGIVMPDQVAKILDSDPDSPYAGVLDTEPLDVPEDGDIEAIAGYVEALTARGQNMGPGVHFAPADTDAREPLDPAQPPLPPAVASLYVQSKLPQSAIPTKDLVVGAQDAAPELAAGAAYFADHEAGPRVLLLQRPDGTWGFPAGKIEEGETPSQAARRELAEETGYRYRGGFKRVGLYDDMFHCFTAKTQQFPVVLNDEHTGHGWFPLDALPDPLHKSVGIQVDHAKAVHADGGAMDAHWITANSAHLLVGGSAEGGKGKKKGSIAEAVHAAAKATHEGVKEARGELDGK